MGIRSEAWVLKESGKPLVKESIELAEPTATEVVVEVEACGLCHTDLGFAEGGVAPRMPLPIVLGHEVVGTVRAAGEKYQALIGQKVLVPAVMPCGDCAFCRAGRGNACLKQKMPGNDIHGGFGTHLVAPGASMVSLADAPASVKTDSLSVVADAVSTAYQAVRRSGLKAGDVAFVIGGGGVGGFTAQIAKALGAKTVVCDVHEERLAGLATLGFDHTCNVKGREAKDVRKELHGKAKEWGVPSLDFKIFECSGTAPGQTLAYTLLSNGATMLVVGFTRDSVNVRLSNLMAFDATVHGSWGCPVEAYPAVLKLIYDGKVVLEPFIERAPMSKINQHMKALAEHKLAKRLVMDPRV
ncbi:MAG: 6-hydroxycyclohex-1-ene-1-carbonyl-CoA dehydrogenase [Polyangiaceae bacterium]|nr:6-hydroxycyclohex-1-ene-1-carbonyl-CoA dehydrogenase [Polyangiaceae bacterium]